MRVRPDRRPHGPACPASSPPSTPSATATSRDGPATRGVRALYRATERLGSATVAVSPAVAARLRGWGVPPGRIAVIPNGIDAAAFAFDAARRAATRRRLGIGPAEPVVGALGGSSRPSASTC
ncbi:glycosyltransferase [Actinomadura madurae]|uniref:glycosyltransferase n=1 Tax=Actinomadura madurae TaxID=1993 RepID=UPI0020D213EE|nr:glycosyltransferase [Actinomadura madurae]